ncbi:hypothetical protein DFAR_2960003 [Desulfarculales bacterium]
MVSILVATVHLFLKTINSHVQEVERAFFYTIEALARAAESHDKDPGNHIVRATATPNPWPTPWVASPISSRSWATRPKCTTWASGTSIPTCCASPAV